MNIDTLKWDPVLLNFFEVTSSVLPKIKSSSEVYGNIEVGSLQGVPIAGCVGDQQSALLGQQCLQRGQVKTKCIILMLLSLTAKLFRQKPLTVLVAFCFTILVP